MAIFKKKKKQPEPASNPTLNSVSIPNSESLLDLNRAYQNSSNQEDQDGSTQSQSLSSTTQNEFNPTKVVEGPPPGSYSRTSGRVAISPSSPSSPSLSGTVPQFHRPQIQRGPPPSSFHHSNPFIPNLFNNNSHNDFRQSPFANPPPNPSVQRKIHEMARNRSLKKSKVPKNFNIMVAGSKDCGKTSWIRSFLETLELGQSALNVKEAAGSFGLSPNSSLPIPTTSISTLSSLPISDQALLQALPSSLQESTLSDPTTDSPNETSSLKRSSSINGSGYGLPSCRLLLSITDTPGLDFQREDGFQIERKVSSTIRFIEEKMRETLIEEKKVDRRSHGGFNSTNGGLSSQHVHVLLYFIDSENLVVREVENGIAKIDNSKKKQVEVVENGHNLGSKHVRQNSKSENDVSSKNLLKRSNSESSLAASNKFATKPNKLSNGTSSSEEDPKKPKKTELSLSKTELKILKRLSERVNIIPIIGCSDKLTENQLIKVREAIKKGMKEVLGEKAMFEILGGKCDKEDEEEEEGEGDPIKLRGGRKSRFRDLVNTPPTVNSSPSPLVEDDGPEEALENGGVKLIRIKSRRSFSRSGITDSTFDENPEETSHNKISRQNSIGMSRSISSTSSLDHTSPLFTQDEDQHPLSRLISNDLSSLEKIYPFSLISPELSFEKSKVSIGLGSTRARSGSRHSLNRVRSLSNASVDPNLNNGGNGRVRTLSNVSVSNKDGEKDSAKIGLGLDSTTSNEIEKQILEGQVPPVPPIPAQLQQTKIQLQDENPNANPNPNSPPSQDNVNNTSSPNQTQSPKMNRSSSNASSIISRPRPVSAPRGPHPFDPNRFVRNYKWSKIDLLNVDHCDFLPLRALLLKTNVENLLRRTDDLYEDYRSQRLENRRETSEVPEAHERLIRSLSIL